MLPNPAPGPRPPGSAAQALDRAWRAAAGRRTLLATDDRDCARSLVGRVFRPHRLEPAAGTPLDVRMEHLGTGLLGLSLLRYGGAVDILPGPLDDFYLLQMPLSGQARIETAGQVFRSDETCASLVSPRPDLRMHWGQGNAQLCVRIEADSLRRLLAAWTGNARVPAPVFDPRVPLDGQPALVAVLAELLAAASQPMLGPLPTAQLQQRLMAALLTQLPHDASQQLADGGPPATPVCVRVVEEHLMARCEEPWTAESLAMLAGVSARSLFLGFQRHRGVSPMRLLRELRLRRVRDDLLAGSTGSPCPSVTDVALRWGFTHLGRFGQAYAQAFGETPSQTLRAAAGVRPAPPAARGPARPAGC